MLKKNNSNDKYINGHHASHGPNKNNHTDDHCSHDAVTKYNHSNHSVKHISTHNLAAKNSTDKKDVNHDQADTQNMHDAISNSLQSTQHQELIAALSKEVESLKSKIEHKPRIQGWLLISFALVLFLHVYIGINFINNLVLLIAAYFFIYGALKVHLLEKCNETLAAVKHYITRRTIKSKK